MAQKQAQKNKQDQAQSQKQVQDLAEVVDRAYYLDKDIKAKQDELKRLKGTLKEQAEARQVKEIEGYESKISFSDEETTEIDPSELYSFLLSNGFDLDTFLSLVKVKVSDAKKAIGYVILDEVAKTEYKERAKSSLKPIKKEE